MYLAVLFVLYIASLIGAYAGKQVPDEIEGAGKYLSLAPDALLLIMVALALLAYDLRLIAAAAVAALIVLRLFMPLRAVYAPASGMALAAGLGTDAAIPLALLCLALNYVWGASESDPWHVGRHGALQPVAAAIVLIAI